MMELPWLWRGRQTLRASLEEQEARYQALRRGEPAMALLLCEHAPVITLGRYGKASNIVASSEALAAAGVAIEHVDRGGDVTYHGPGQLMVYPVVAVRSLRGFIGAVGEALAGALRDHGIKASWRCDPAGVWVDDRKIAACGFHVRHGIVNHGFALNIFHTEQPWQWIVACGAGAQVTSIAACSGRATSPSANVAAWADLVGPRLVAAIAPWMSYRTRITAP